MDTLGLLRLLGPHKHVLLFGVAALIAADFISLVPPLLIKKAIDAIEAMVSMGALFFYLLVLVGLALFQAVFRFFWRRAVFGASRKSEAQLRERLFRHLQQMDRSFYLRHPTGEIISRCGNDLVAVQEFLAYFVPLMVDAALMTGGCLWLMTLVDPLLTAVAMGPMPLLMVTFMYFGRKVRQKSAEVQRELSNLTHMVQETIHAISFIQAYTMERTRNAQYRRATRSYIRRNIELSTLRGLFYATLGVVTGIAGLLVLWLGSHRISSGDLSLGGFVAFNSYLLMLSWPMMSIGFMVNLLQRGRASMDRIRQLLDQRPSIREGEARKCFMPRGLELRFDVVDFRYPGSSTHALREITMEIPHGAKVGVTGPVGCGKSTLLLPTSGRIKVYRFEGPVGCGKSTLLLLVPRIFDPTGGRILLGGVELSSIPLRELRSIVSLVEQEPFLFSESIEENIRFGASNEDDLRYVLSVSGLEREMEMFPQGLSTVVGERGVRISGGQRQRVALARALMKRPSILLLDDAFAHCDADTEAEAMRRIIGEACPHVTVVFTSNRFSTLMMADWVVVLDKGIVVEQGPPQDLIKRGWYLAAMMEQLTGVVSR
jgi:ATP-binding cassette subfamily B protein